MTTKTVISTPPYAICLRRTKPCESSEHPESIFQSPCQVTCGLCSGCWDQWGEACSDWCTDLDWCLEDCTSYWLFIPCCQLIPYDIVVKWMRVLTARLGLTSLRFLGRPYYCSALDRIEADGLTSRYPMEWALVRWIDMPSKMSLLVQRQRVGMRYFRSAFRLFPNCSPAKRTPNQY